MMKFPITVGEGGTCDLRPLIAHITSLHGNYMVTVTRDARHRTNPQNRWLWGCIYPMLLDGLVAAGWEFTSSEEVHDWCGRFRDREVVNRYTGEVVHVPQSTKDMDTAEMTAYCETLRDFAQEYLNLSIPDPDPEYYGKA